MNATHVHLLVNHLAAVGIFLGLIVLLFAVKEDTLNTYFAGYAVMVIAIIGGITAYLTGEAAEASVETIPGMIESTIESHEESALVTVIGFAALGLFAVAGAIATYRKQNVRKFGVAVLILGVLSFLFAARTAWLGGKIRHTEISGSSTVVNPNANEPKESPD